jgi:endothelin-converting enzyme/putative endopeptidase
MTALRREGALKPTEIQSRGSDLNEKGRSGDRHRHRPDVPCGRKLIEQYNRLEPRALPGHKVNGAMTVGENIGDLGGLTVGLQAYEISLGGEDAPVLDDLTGRQRVFVNWARVWRSKRREEYERQLLAVDVHSPPELRANIARNLDEFHQAFGTQPGDGLWLDPEERVHIW